MDELLAPTSTVHVFALMGQAEPTLVADAREKRKVRDELIGLLALLLALIVLRPSVPRTRSTAWSQKSTALATMSRHGPRCGAAPGCGRHHVRAERPSPSPAVKASERRRCKMSVLSYKLPLRIKLYYKTSLGAQTFDPISGLLAAPSIVLVAREGRSCGGHRQ